MQHDLVGTGKERIRNLNLKGLRVVAADWLSLTLVSPCRISIGILRLRLLLAIFLVLLEDLIASLLKLIIAVIENFAELEGHLGVALTRVGV